MSHPIRSDSTAAGARPGNPDLAAHMPVLDGIRAVAVLLVIAHHVYLGARPSLLLDRWATGFAVSGWIGVDLFFVLSGFLITGLLLDAQGSPRYYRAFYWRRTLRIFPLYYAYLAAVFLLPALFGTALYPNAAGDQLWFWLYLSNYRLAEGWILGGRGLNHLWSLAIEEHFYLVWPTLVRSIRRAKLAWLAVGVLLCSVALRYLSSHAGSSNLALYLMTHTRLDGLAAGALLALLARREGGLLRWRGAAWWALAAGCAALFVEGVTHAGLHFTRFDALANAWVYFVLAVTFAALLLIALTAAPSSAWKRALGSPLLRLIGRHSYAIYILHLGVYGALRSQGLHPERWAERGALWLPYYIALYFLVAALSLLCAVVSWHLIEKHFLRMKDRVPY